jgi:UDP-N-acetylglucosamine:LPS N-acetylglucosamine transferase
MNNVPTVVMPYPFHKDDHQRSNALPLAILGGVRIATDHKMLDKNLYDAGDCILELMNNHQMRFEMRQSMVSASPNNGATAIADACVSCVNAAQG